MILKGILNFNTTMAKLLSNIIIEYRGTKSKLPKIKNYTYII